MIMKKLILSLMLVSTVMLCAQESKETSNTVLVTSSVSKEYKPDYYKVFVNFKEYENVNPDDQKVTRFNISEVEQSLNKKLEELSVKSSSLEVVNLDKNNTQAQNIYGYNANYTATQKREISKTISFDVKTVKELEKVFSTLRINGVSNVYAQPMISNETQLKIENELLQMTMEKARSKANKLEVLMGKKLGEVVTVSEETVMNQDQMYINYNNYYRNVGYMNNGTCSKTMTVKVTYAIE